MYKAADVSEALKMMLSEYRMEKPDIVNEIALMCLGWPYVFGAAGEMCTPEIRRKYAGYHPEYKTNIYNACPVLSGKQATCDGCKWAGCRCFDCRGFTRWLLEQAGLSLAGGGATSQYDTNSNWAVKGKIEDMPRGLVCCVFKRKGNTMSHTGMHVGGGRIIHCSTNVKTGTLKDSPAWTHFGIPAGLYTDEELKEAGVNVEDGRNIPTLRRGATGDLVKYLQMDLNEETGAGLDVDGVFGAKTEAALRAFQQLHGLTVDGICGPETWKALESCEDKPTQAPKENEPDEPDPPEDASADAHPPDAARGNHQVFVYGGGRIVWKDTVNVGAGQEPETDPAPQEPKESALSLDRLKALKALLVPLLREVEQAIAAREEAARC